MNEITIVLAGIFIGWLLKSMSDYTSARLSSSRIYNQAIFQILKTWKHLKDYDRATEHFRKDNPPVEKFEPWRATLASQLNHDIGKNDQSSSEAATTLSQIDPAFATELDNSLRRVVFSLNNANFENIIEIDPERYVQLVYNQDQLIDLALHEYKQAAFKLSNRVSLLQRYRVNKYINYVEKGTDYFKGMEQNKELLNKAMDL